MAVHSLDDGTIIYDTSNKKITGEQERFAFFEFVEAEQRRLLRNDRNKRLADCDWVVTKHVEQGLPVPQDWQTYRQALRDVTNDHSSQHDVTWPTEPQQ